VLCKARTIFSSQRIVLVNAVLKQYNIYVSLRLRIRTSRLASSIVGRRFCLQELMDYKDLKLDKYQEEALISEMKNLLDKQKEWNVTQAWFETVVGYLIRSGYNISKLK
jgi:hypothetical protein